MSLQSLAKTKKELQIFSENPAISDQGLTVRTSTTSLLTISSQDRGATVADLRPFNTTNTSYDFTIQRPTNILAGFFTRIFVNEINFQWTIPNINEKTCQIGLSYRTGAGTTNVIIAIDVGFYTPHQLAIAMEEAVNAEIFGAIIGPFQFSYGTNYLPAFYYNAAAVPGILGVAFYPMTPNTIAYPFSSDTVQLFDLLGFTTGGVAYSNDTLSLASTGRTTSCTPYQFLDIVCTQLTANQGLKDGSTQESVQTALARVYIGQNAQNTVLPNDPNYCPPGCAPTNIYINYSNPKVIQWQPNQNIGGYLRFQVLDDTGNPVEFGKNFAGSPSLNAYNNIWNMTLLVSEQ